MTNKDKLEVAMAIVAGDQAPPKSMQHFDTYTCLLVKAQLGKRAAADYTDLFDLDYDHESNVWDLWDMHPIDKREQRLMMLAMYHAIV
jgi:hypothetical protein